MINEVSWSWERNRWIFATEILKIVQIYQNQKGLSFFPQGIHLVQSTFFFLRMFTNILKIKCELLVLLKYHGKCYEYLL